MIEPTTIGIQSCTRADLEKDDLLLIYGSGALGSSILKIARLLCDHIIVADVVDDKLEAAKANGATHTINVLKENPVSYTHLSPRISIPGQCMNRYKGMAAPQTRML